MLSINIYLTNGITSIIIVQSHRSQIQSIIIFVTQKLVTLCHPNTHCSFFGLATNNTNNREGGIWDTFLTGKGMLTRSGAITYPYHTNFHRLKFWHFLFTPKQTRLKFDKSKLMRTNLLSKGVRRASLLFFFYFFVFLRVSTSPKIFCTDSTFSFPHTQAPLASIFDTKKGSLCDSW